jgi:hypothetical protein
MFPFLGYRLRNFLSSLHKHCKLTGANRGNFSRPLWLTKIINSKPLGYFSDPNNPVFQKGKTNKTPLSLENTWN